MRTDRGMHDASLGSLNDSTGHFRSDWPATGPWLPPATIPLVTPTLRTVRTELRKAADPRVAASTAKYVPTARRVYGVRLPILNALAKDCRSGGFALVEELWRAGAYEERLLATKLLGAVAQRDPIRALTFLRNAARDIGDWVICDTIATQGMRPVARTHGPELFGLAESLTASKSVWQRRLGIVLLTNFAKRPDSRAAIRKVLAPLRNDPEPYVRKALMWIDKDLDRGSEPLAASHRDAQGVRRASVRRF